MKNTILFIMCMIIIAGFVVSCSDDDDNGTGPNGNSGDLIPMAVGNYWVTRMIDFDSLGDTTSVDTSRVTIIRTQDIGGNTYYVAIDSTDDIDTAYYRKASDGYYAIMQDTTMPSDSMEIKMAPIPYTDGTTWQIMDPMDSSSTEGGYLQVYRFSMSGIVIGETSFDTPAGSFSNAIRLDYIIEIEFSAVDTASDDTLFSMSEVDTNRNYMVPDIGPVGMDSYYNNGQQMDKDRLLEYNLE